MDQNQKVIDIRYSTILLVVLIALTVSFGLVDKNEDETTDENDFAVVELFTSQGCSSCPAADRLLSEFIAKKDDKVFGLSFHVSYWNYLGWKDPYSKEEFTERQRQYARTFNNSNIYTPQMVVNGTKEFVGSNRVAAEKAMEQAFASSNKHNISLNIVQENNKLDISYTLDGSLSEQLVNFAVVEKDREDLVSRGENRNRTLHHDNVVRLFKTLPADKAGIVTMSLPGDLNLDKSAVIAYVQHKRTMAITGATRSRLANK